MRLAWIKGRKVSFGVFWSMVTWRYDIVSKNLLKNGGATQILSLRSNCMYSSAESAPATNRSALYQSWVKEASFVEQGIRHL